MGRSRKVRFESFETAKKVKCFVPIFETMVVFRVEAIESFYKLIGEVIEFEIEIIIKNQKDIDKRNIEYLRA